jgi:hypothetical protein
MAILITRVKAAESQVLKVDGHLTAQDTETLVCACEGLASGLVLDLGDLRSADRRGVTALRQLRSRGALLTGLSPYLTLLLGEPASPKRS